MQQFSTWGPCVLPLKVPTHMGPTWNPCVYHLYCPCWPMFVYSIWGPMWAAGHWGLQKFSTWGPCTLPLEIPTSQAIKMVNPAGVRWHPQVIVPVYYAAMGSCKVICIFIVTQKWTQTSRMWDQEITWKHGVTNYIWSLQQSTLVVRFHIRFQRGTNVCKKNIPAHMQLYCNLSRNWRWHYMAFTLVGPWNCPCEANVLPPIGITWSVHWSTHRISDVKPLFCQTLALDGIYSCRLKKLPM